MTIEPETLRAMNQAHARLQLSPARIDELPIELNQLKAAIENVAAMPSFDSEPSGFRVALMSLAATAADCGEER